MHLRLYPHSSTPPQPLDAKPQKLHHEPTTPDRVVYIPNPKQSPKPDTLNTKLRNPLFSLCLKDVAGAVRTHEPQNGRDAELGLPV